ncbi:MAG TPA: Hsp20/alpha crystallin family protein [Candidatus Pullilachnospira intestinigallinarum]|nr:Hsp20/alpha crystallin family protein [Candidatus Pullilachnospira intestinigallinarum]
MLMPSIFGENLFDEFMDFPFEREFFKRTPSRRSSDQTLMKTDVKETDGTYELDIDLPGYKKEDVSAKLEDGYLTISASTNKNNDEKDKEGRYIRRERYTGQCSRSFYVGEGVAQDQIKAKFENGILKLSIPKVEKQQVEEKKYISIEG